MGLQISLVSSNASGHINTVSTVLNPNNMFISVTSFTADSSANSVNTVQRRPVTPWHYFFQAWYCILWKSSAEI